MAVTWLKKKYTQEKTKGRYRSSHNMSTKNKRNKAGKTQPPNGVVLRISATGKRRFVRESV